MRFDRILSFGRTGAELLEMFALEPRHLAGLRVLDCPGGPGSLSPDELDARTRADISVVALQLPGDSNIHDDFDRAGYFEAKLEAFRQFQGDRRTHPGGHMVAGLPALPFADGHFDLVLSGSLLFAYAPVRDGGLMDEPGLGLEPRHLREPLRPGHQG